uniref:ATP synthase complex subunit 8 n=1 Tax=Squalomugil nasutus TaxID=1040953 RepID=I1T2E0_SQUNS|nr:ATP synthase F0 subunit 8 [Squalomugil nasutus]AEK53162.1 ATP synthase F0 subunit 8 [Squalomugil nasutus]
MPHLIPTPWFPLFIFTWFTFVLYPSKVLTINFPHEPGYNPAKQPKNTPWIWPWH